MSGSISNQEMDIKTPDEAMRIAKQLLRSGHNFKYFEKLLYKLFNVWSRNDISIDMVEQILDLFIDLRFKARGNSYRSNGFIENCVQTSIETGDINRCFKILEKMNRTHFASHYFIEFLWAHVLAIDSSDEEALEKLITFVKACHLAKYKIDAAELKTLLNEFPFQNYMKRKLSWEYFARQLDEIGVYHRPLIDAVLANEGKYVRYPSNFSKLRILLKIRSENLAYNTFNEKLSAALKDIFGSYKLRESVDLSGGLKIPFLLKVDKVTKDLLLWDEKAKYPLENVDRKRCALIALVCEPDIEGKAAFALLIDTLEAYGITSITFNADKWLKLPVYKQVSYLFDAINSIARGQATNIHIKEIE